MEIGNWSMTATNNGFPSPDGAQDGWLGKDVNNVVREIMAVLRRWYADPEYLDLCWTAVDTAATLTRNSATEIVVNGVNLTTTMTPGRRIRITGTTPASDEGHILGSVFSSPNTVVTVEMTLGSIPTTPTKLLVHACKSLPVTAFVGSPPAGTIIDYAGTVIPIGYLECNGAAVAKTTYAELWAAFGSAHVWGADPGSGKFLLPDLRGKVALGWKTDGDTDGDYGTVGGAYGSKKLTVTDTERTSTIQSVSHRHDYYPGTGSQSSTYDEHDSPGHTDYTHTHKVTYPIVDSATGKQENRQPSVVVHKLIKT